ncbi:hypothetical protein RJZ90_000347 [Blastomyces dermatitidis]
MSLLSKRLFRACCCEVLVPELLEMLVREDMGVDARGARRILKESNKIGKLLNLEQIDCDTLRRWQRSTASDFTLDHNQTVTLFLTNRHNFLETYTAPMAQPVSLASGIITLAGFAFASNHCIRRSRAFAIPNERLGS